MIAYTGSLALMPNEPIKYTCVRRPLGLTPASRLWPHFIKVSSFYHNKCLFNCSFLDSCNCVICVYEGKKYMLLIDFLSSTTSVGE